MTDTELRKLKRSELLEILLEQAKELERLEEENSTLKKQLEDRRIRVQNAGTMAEAAFALNGVFEAADAAVRQYMENIRAAAEEREEPDEVQEPNEAQEPDEAEEPDEAQEPDEEQEPNDEKEADPAWRVQDLNE